MVASNIPPVRLRSWCIRKGLRWSIISAFMKTRISQVSATIPFVGYALLWSEEIKKYLELQVALHGGLWFSTTTRLLLVYFGAIFLALAWAIYGIWCPAVIKRMTDVSDYLLSELQTSNGVEYGRICKLLALKRRIISAEPRQVEWMEALVSPNLTDEISLKKLDRALQRNSPSQEERSLVLQAWYLSKEGEKFIGQIAAAGCIFLGMVLVTLPSLEVFCAVVARVLLPTLGFR